MPVPTHNWTELDPPIIECYQTGGSVAELAARLGIPYGTLHWRASYLRRVGRLDAYLQPRYTERDIRAMRSRAPWRKVAAALGRNENGLRQKAAKIGLGRSANYSMHDLAVAVGCHDGVARRWIKNGLLKARTNGEDGPGRRYFLSERALAAFFRAHPDRWQHFPCPGRLWIDGLIEAAL